MAQRDHRDRWAKGRPRPRSPGRSRPGYGSVPGQPSASGTAAASQPEGWAGPVGGLDAFRSPASPPDADSSSMAGRRGSCGLRRGPLRSGSVGVPSGQGSAQVDEALDGCLVRRRTGEEHIEPAVGISTVHQPARDGVRGHRPRPRAIRRSPRPKPPRVCTNCDVSGGAVQDLGRYVSRDEVFRIYGQTLCVAARVAAEPFLGRLSPRSSRRYRG